MSVVYWKTGTYSTAEKYKVTWGGVGWGGGYTKKYKMNGFCYHTCLIECLLPVCDSITRMLLSEKGHVQAYVFDARLLDFANPH